MKEMRTGGVSTGTSNSVATPRPARPLTDTRPHPFPRIRSGPGSRSGSHLAVDQLVELLAEIGHEHSHCGRIPRAGAETPAALEVVKTPAKPRLFRLARASSQSFLAFSSFLIGSRWATANKAPLLAAGEVPPPAHSPREASSGVRLRTLLLPLTLTSSHPKPPTLGGHLYFGKVCLPFHLGCSGKKILLDIK